MEPVTLFTDQEHEEYQSYLRAYEECWHEHHTVAEQSGARFPNAYPAIMNDERSIGFTHTLYGHTYPSKPEYIRQSPGWIEVWAYERYKRFGEKRGH